MEGRGGRRLLNTVDHPEIDRTVVPARLDQDVLGEDQRQALAHGEGVELDGNDALSRLKVFEEQDNQLGVEDIVKACLPCLECGADGTLQRADLKIPKFGTCEIQSFVCSNCSYSYRRVRVLEFERLNVEPLENGHGRRISLMCQTVKDLNREVVQSDGCLLKVPEIDLEVMSTDGAMSTVEGTLRAVVAKLRFTHFSSNNLSIPGGVQIADHLESQISTLIDRLKDEDKPFEFIIEDNEDASHIETFDNDTQIVFTSYPLEAFQQTTTYSDGGVANEYMCGFDGISIGAVVQAMYNDTWVPNCKIVNVLTNDEGASVIQVEEIDNAQGGKWYISSEEIRGCDNPGCACQTFSSGEAEPSSGNTVADENAVQESLEYLNRWAEHIEAQEGLATSSIKKEMNKEAIEKRDFEYLESLD